MIARARPLFTKTATLFGALRPSLFETEYRLSISATAYDVRAKTRALDSSQERTDKTILSFSYASRTTSSSCLDER